MGRLWAEAIFIAASSEASAGTELPATDRLLFVDRTICFMITRHKAAGTEDLQKLILK